MNVINCLIVDDEELARNLLENYINRLPHLQIVGKCADPLEAMQVLQEKTVDLMFLDIQMPELTGVEFLKILTQKPLVIFTTAYKEYALEGYELDIVDYLLKPFRFKRFLQAVNKAGKTLKNEKTEEVNTPSIPQKKITEKPYILVKSDFKIFRILYDDILYIESMKEYVAYHTTTNKRTLSLGSLKKLEIDLPSDKFMRIHKSYIVANAKVSALEGNQVHIGTIKLPIGTSYREKVLAGLF
jgi:DNA-binding LytR/AlgR family response regulator